MINDSARDDIRRLQRDFHEMERDLVDLKDDLQWRERKFEYLEGKFNSLCELLAKLNTADMAQEIATIRNR